MKTIPILALGAILIGSAGMAQAGPFDFLKKKDPPRNQHHDHDRDRHDNHDHGRDRRMSTEAKAQLRLRELGYYRGPVDGSFGRVSREALTRFQRDRHLRPTGYLDERTRRALRI